ncbi:putative enolase-like protein ENO4 [Apostichopus japonicus]|uniref:Enolase 4 n=1 Tax=Stichopus japonicus TaxID=307972 RepID=A0A2G8KNE0_STIJA|nr:putative enolase-like protein ENO4 [Apostichopus japonicus]
MAASRSSQRNAREFFELKQRAVQFYKENKLPEKLEDILNAMVYEQPPDVYGRLSEYFESISSPIVISKFQANQVLDSRGQPTIQADVHCIRKGIEECMASSTMASYNHLTDTAPPDQKESEDKERQESVLAAIEFIQGPISEGLSGLDPTQQKEADDIVCSIINKLKEENEALNEEKSPAKVEIADEAKSETSKPETKNASAKGKKKSGSAKSTTVVIQEPKEPMFCGCNAVCVVSQAVARVGSEVKGIPLYEYIASLCYEDSPYQFSFPIPMMTVLSSGKASPGKQNLLKEVLLIPKPDLSFCESVQQLTQIYQRVSNLHFSKVGVVAYYTNDFGGVCPQYDRPDQLLDHITEALLSLGLTAGEDIFIGLNCAAHEIYDPDKGKYEVMSGALKTGDDMLEVYGDLITRYPGIIALIDPLRKHDITALERLCSQFSEKCFILGDQVYPRPEKFLLTGFDKLNLNGATLKLQQMTAVTDVLKASRMIHDNGCVSIIAGVQGDTTDPFLADLAVGAQATFVKFGAPTRGERVALYNRLSRISDELSSKGALVARTKFPFRAIHQPEPQDGDDDGTSQTKDDESKEPESKN